MHPGSSKERASMSSRVMMGCMPTSPCSRSPRPQDRLRGCSAASSASSAGTLLRVQSRRLCHGAVKLLHAPPSRSPPVGRPEQAAIDCLC